PGGSPTGRRHLRERPARLSPNPHRRGPRVGHGRPAVCRPVSPSVGFAAADSTPRGAHGPRRRRHPGRRRQNPGVGRASPQAICRPGQVVLCFAWRSAAAFFDFLSWRFSFRLFEATFLVAGPPLSLLAMTFSILGRRGDSCPAMFAPDAGYGRTPGFAPAVRGWRRPDRHPSSGAGGVPPGLSCAGPQRDLAMLTVSWRPPTSRPSRASMARRASFDEAISTKPKPRERPVSRSVTTCALVTW